MTNIRTPAQCDRASDEARDAWAAIKRKNRRFTSKSPVDGLAERIRSAKNPRALNPAKRVAEREAARRRHRAALAANRIPYKRPEDGGRYFPHQAPRETARRLRQIAAGQINHHSGLTA